MVPRGLKYDFCISFARNRKYESLEYKNGRTAPRQVIVLRREEAAASPGSGADGEEPEVGEEDDLEIGEGEEANTQHQHATVYTSGYSIAAGKVRATAASYLKTYRGESWCNRGAARPRPRTQRRRRLRRAPGRRAAPRAAALLAPPGSAQAQDPISTSMS